jgi:hypothetical protein
VEPSMPRDQRERYARAFHYAVIEKNLSFERAEQFAYYWARAGYQVRRNIGDGFMSWAAQTFPRAVDDDEE